jgi:hypothetical protein
VLKVKNLDSGNYLVSWGSESKVFDAHALNEGINMADAFETTPFDGGFYGVKNLVKAKQEALARLTEARRSLPEAMDVKELTARQQEFNKLYTAQEQNFDEAIIRQLTPVTHKILVEKR